jgi:RNA polymerase sigma-70 factor (ECF subfamily)
MKELSMPLEQERELVCKAQKNLNDFVPLYEYYLPKIYRYISFKIRDQQAVEDIVAQVFCDALEHLSSFQWRGISFGAWLYKIAYHMVMDYYKKPVVQPFSDESNIPHQQDLVEEINSSWSLEKVYEALKTLPEISQQIVTLRIAEGLSHQEIGFIIGKSADSTKVYYSKAIQQLRKIILITSFILFIFWHLYV